MPANPQPWQWIQRRLREIAYATNPTPLTADEQATLTRRCEATQEYREGVANYRRAHFARWLHDTGRIGG